MFESIGNVLSSVASSIQDVGEGAAEFASKAWDYTKNEYPDHWKQRQKRRKGTAGKFDDLSHPNVTDAGAILAELHSMETQGE